MTRAYRYLFPIINKYPMEVYTKLATARIEDVYLGYLDEEGDFFVLTNNNVVLDEYITGCYYVPKEKKYIVKVRIIEKFQYMLDLFWQGKYDQLYKEPLSHFNIPKAFGNKLNMTYHTLMNTDIGKSNFKEMLVKHGYVDPKLKINGQTWEDFIPDQSDYPPKKEKEIYV